MKTILTILLGLALLACKTPPDTEDAAASEDLDSGVPANHVIRAAGLPSLSFYIVPTDSFQTTVQKMGLTPYAYYVFGADAGAAGGVTTIRSMGDLATYFQPFLTTDGTAIFSQNGQLERYQPFDSGAAPNNYVFNPSFLALTVTLDDGGTATVVGDVVPSGVNEMAISTNAGVDGKVNCFYPWANLNSGNVTVGRMLAVQAIGAYVVTAVDAGGTCDGGAGGAFAVGVIPHTGLSTNVTGGNRGVALLPAYTAALNANYVANTTTMSFAAVPSGVTGGMSVSADTANNGAPTWFGQSYVNDAGATSVGLDVGMKAGVNSGQNIYFTPPIRSGQAWLQSYVPTPLFNGVLASAFDTLIQVPGPAARFLVGAGAAGTCTAGACNPSNQPAGNPAGAWPASWVFSGAADGGTTFADNSEFDLLEVFNEGNYGSIGFSCSLGGGTSAGNPSSFWTWKNQFVADGGWDAFHHVILNSEVSGTPHHWQAIVTPTQAANYFDGTLMTINTFYWSSGQQGQYGSNVSAGSINPGFSGNMLFPYNNAQFPYSANLYSMRIWQR